MWAPALEVGTATSKKKGGETGRVFPLRPSQRLGLSLARRCGHWNIKELEGLRASQTVVVSRVKLLP